MNPNALALSTAVQVPHFIVAHRYSWAWIRSIFTAIVMGNRFRYKSISDIVAVDATSPTLWTRIDLQLTLQWQATNWWGWRPWGLPTGFEHLMTVKQIGRAYNLSSQCLRWLCQYLLSSVFFDIICQPTNSVLLLQFKMCSAVFICNNRPKCKIVTSLAIMKYIAVD